MRGSVKGIHIEDEPISFDDVTYEDVEGVALELMDEGGEETVR